MRQTLVVQSATPMLAVLPILAKEAHGDVKYANRCGRNEYGFICSRSTDLDGDLYNLFSVI